MNILKKIKTPDFYLSALFAKVQQNTKFAFFCGIGSAFITHLFFFTDRYMNEDDAHFITTSLWGISSGRFMLPNPISSPHVLPIVMFIIVLLSLALICGMVVSMFRIERKPYIILACILLCSSPCLAMMFGYTHSIEVLSLGLLTAVIAVWCSKQWRFGFIPGAFFLSVSIGFYQSNFTLAIGLAVMLLILDTFEPSITFKQWFCNAIKFLSLGIIGIILYIVTVRIIVSFIGYPIGSYMGLDSMGIPPIRMFPALIERTYINFFDYFKGKLFLGGSSASIMLRQSFLYAIPFLLIFLIIKKRMYRKILLLISALILTIIIPFTLNMIDFIAYKAYATTLQTYPYALIYVFPIALVSVFQSSDEVKNKWEPLYTLCSWVVMIMVLLMSWNGIQISNVYYSKASEYYAYTVAMNNRVLARLETTTDFTMDTPIAIITEDSDYIYQGNYGGRDYDYIFLSDRGYWKAFIGYNNQYYEGTGGATATNKIVSYFMNMMGVELKAAPVDKVEEIMKGQRYADMPAWPALGSIEVIDGVAIIKMSQGVKVTATKQDGNLIKFNVDRETYGLSDEYYFAWYIYRNNEFILSHWDDPDPRYRTSVYEYTATEPGEYYCITYFIGPIGRGGQPSNKIIIE